MSNITREVHVYLTVRVSVGNVPGTTDQEIMRAASGAAIDEILKLTNRFKPDIEEVELSAREVAYADSIVGYTIDTIDGDQRTSRNFDQLQAAEVEETDSSPLWMVGILDQFFTDWRETRDGRDEDGFQSAEARWARIRPHLINLGPKLTRTRQLVRELDELGFYSADEEVSGSDTISVLQDHLPDLRSMAMFPVGLLQNTEAASAEDEIPEGPYTLVAVVGDVEPEIQGRYPTYEDLLEEARTYRQEEGDNDGLYYITVDAHGPVMHSFGAAELLIEDEADADDDDD